MPESALNIEDIVNVDDYPIDDRNHSARQALIDRCRSDLEHNLCCVIPNFIRPAALDAMAAEATGLEPAANHNNALRNCYLHRQQDASLPAEHPRNLQDRSSVRMIAHDQIPEVSPLKNFYHSDPVRKLIADIVGEGELFENADPYQPANYVCYREGDESSWHFDSDNSFTMTLMIQPAEEGGDFAMSPNTRSDDDQNYEHVGQVLRGELDDKIASIGREPGALCIFRGCNSLHRVSPVHGNVLRIMGVFVYEFSPGLVGDPEVNATIYGARTGV
jgi:hypothetical protein